MKRVRIRKGVLLASGLIGPIVALPAFVGPIVPGVDDVGTVLTGLGAMLLSSAAFGFSFSILPNLLGATLLGRLGERHATARNPGIWAVVGGCMAAPLGLLAGPTARGSAAGSIVSFAVIGLISALICRSGTRWSD